MTKRSARLAVLEAAYENWRAPGYIGSVAYRARRVSPRLFEWLMDRKLLLRTRQGPILRARLRDAIGPAEVFGLGEYDIPLIDWTAVGYVIDAGAHVGGFTLWVAQRSACRVMALEPNPAARGLLDENVALSGLRDRVAVRPWALARAREVRRLRPAEDSAATSLVADVTRGDVEVQSVALAEAIEASGYPQVDVLKMDIEGAEYEVLDAADAETLERVHAWIVECHETPGRNPDSIADRLRHAGFQVSAVQKPRGQRLVIARR